MIEDIKKECRSVEGTLGALHERAAALRDALPSGAEKAMARRVANRIEGALQRLEGID